MLAGLRCSAAGICLVVAKLSTCERDWLVSLLSSRAPYGASSLMDSRVPVQVGVTATVLWPHAVTADNQ